MDPAKTPLGKMLLEGISPVVMVLHTTLVEEACLKNGLTFLQMLSPFCSFSNIDVPVRTASDQPYRIQKFKLRLVHALDIQKPNWEVSKERLKNVITEAGDKVLSELGSDPSQIDNVLGRSESESEVLPPWFQIFNEELLCAASFSEHEAFDHPVACLLAVSSDDEHPINRFVDFFNSEKLPSLFNDGSMDTKILKHYLLVHDNQNGNLEKAGKLLSEMRSTFGSNDCQLLCINSSKEGSVEYQDSPWDSLISDVSMKQHTGCLINNDDLNEIKDFMQDLSSQRIIPYMEEKIRLLNQQVSSTRKGLRNQIKNLWWRKGKEDTVESPNGPIYTFSSIESQIRVLGDYAFMLRDYELALTNYRLISTDYKLDKAWKRYAGVQEMMGLTYFMLDQSRKEAEYCMENAFTTYLKIGSSAQRNATRCGIWWAEMLKTRDQYKEAAAVCSRICGEEILHSAVMLEQASFCYLLSTPPLLRKYGFHLVLSGDRYKRSDQIKHAIRTYTNALSIFKGTMWSHIKDHVYFHIGQWYAFLGMYDVAVSKMLEVLACSHQSMATQELFLKDFLQTVQKTGRTYEVLKLQLPKINFSSLKIAFEDHRTYASPEAGGVKESLWRSFEEDLIPSLTSAKSNWLDLHSNIVSKTYKESNVCVAGELVKVDIEFKNPLQIPISISCVSLICELSAESTETSSDERNIAVEAQNYGELEKLISRDNRLDKSFTLSEVNFSLGGDDTKIVQLSVTPNVEGILQILGVRWELSSSVIGFHKFESDVAKKKTMKGRLKSKHAPIDNLKFIVIQRLPKLESFIQQLPTIVYAGDLRPLVLELRNRSEYSVKNLKIKISHPRFISIGKQEKSNIEFPTCLEKTMTSEEGRTYDTPSMSNETFFFPEDTSIQEGKPFLWPLWFRAAVTGNISLWFTIYYEMKDTLSIMRYRTLRMQYSVQVLPSLDVTFQINPCSSRLQEFLVRMDVINRTSAEVYLVRQLSSVGKQWEISLLQPVDSIFPSRALLPGQALSVFFVLKDIKNLVGSEDRMSSHLPFSGSDLSLSPCDSDMKIFDISLSPLSDFYHSERLLQERSHVGDSNTVDFVLISQSHKDGVQTGIQDPPRLFSHYKCHCSTSSSIPILWLVDGPRTVYHDFSASFCEIKLSMTVQNSSHTVASVHIDTNDSTTSNSLLSSDEAALVGWYDMSKINDDKVRSEGLGSQMWKPLSPESVSSFVWSGLCSRRVQLEPMSKTEIPLQICVFSQGTFDLSNYVLRWNLLPSNGKEISSGMSLSSGTCRGYPYYLTVLQST